MKISHLLVSLVVVSLLLAGCGGANTSLVPATIQPAATVQEVPTTPQAMVSAQTLSLQEREKLAVLALDSVIQEWQTQNPGRAQYYSRGPVNLAVTDDVDRSLVSTYTIEALVGFFAEFESIDGHFIPTQTAYVQGIVIIGHAFEGPAQVLNDQIQVSVIFQPNMP